jgi:hypothetical protein
MNSKEFVIWLKGFVAAANEYNITPKQFEQIVEQLSKVSDGTNVYYGTTTASTIGTPNTTSTNIANIKASNLTTING